MAAQEAAKAKAVRDFLVSIFQNAETDVKGANVTVGQLLEEADKRIPGVQGPGGTARELLKAIERGETWHWPANACRP